MDLPESIANLLHSSVRVPIHVSVSVCLCFCCCCLCSLSLPNVLAPSVFLLPPSRCHFLCVALLSLSLGSPSLGLSFFCFCKSVLLTLCKRPSLSCSSTSVSLSASLSVGLSLSLCLCVCLAVSSPAVDVCLSPFPPLVLVSHCVHLPLSLYPCIPVCPPLAHSVALQVCAVRLSLSLSLSLLVSVLCLSLSLSPLSARPRECVMVLEFTGGGTSSRL